MELKTKFKYGDNVQHIYSEFQGFIVGILCRPSNVEYEVLPLTDSQANYRQPIWIDEEMLKEVENIGCQKEIKTT